MNSVGVRLKNKSKIESVPNLPSSPQMIKDLWGIHLSDSFFLGVNSLPSRTTHKGNKSVRN